MARCHCAGTSCTAFASIGKQLGIRDATVLPFMAWICLRIILQEPVILHENSTRFPLELLQRFLGHLYWIDSSNIEASDYGAPVRRERKITRLYHKQKTVMSGVLFSTFNRRFQRVCNMTYRDLYFLHLFVEKIDSVKARHMLF